MPQTDWEKFRVEAISWPTFLKRNLIHLELLAATRRRADGGGILEVGIGSGAQSAALSRLGQSVVAVDNSLRILNAARPNLRRFGREVTTVAADGFRLPFRDATFAVATSQGLMEHFADEGIIRLVREQLRVCRSMVFSIPSDRYPRQDVGDERLMTPDRWLGIVERATDLARYRVRARYYRLDLEALKYSVLARHPLGSFSVLVAVDPR